MSHNMHHRRCKIYTNMGFPFSDFIQTNLSVIPVVMPRKTPAFAWRDYQTVIADNDTAKSWATKYAAGAIVAGKVSGNLLCIDIDIKNDEGRSLFERFMTELSTIAPELVSKAVVQKTYNGGVHLVYRAQTAIGNQKLACTKDNTVLIETRGEGGYFVAAPTPGYELVKGKWDEIATLSVMEQSVLLDVARSFDERSHAPMKTDTTEGFFAVPEQSTRVGDDYDKRMSRDDVVSLLVRHGWEQGKHRADGTVEVTRPGKSVRDGISGTVGYLGDANVLYVFTSSSVFEPGRAYKPHQVLCFLEYNGDFKAMAKALALADPTRTGVAKLKGKRAKNAEAMPTVEEVNEQIAQEIESSNGKVDKKKQIELVRLWVQTNYALRFNTLLQRTECYDADIDGWRTLSDRDVDSMLVSLADANVNYSKEKLLQLLNSQWVEEHSPLREWSAQLQPWKEGDHDYIADLVATVKVAEHQKDFFAKWLPNWLVATVATWTGRGINHTCLVLQGGQGIGKTQWLNKLCPPDLTQYMFAGALVAENKDSILSICENVLINLDELESTTRKDISHLKSLITREKVKERRAYARMTEEFKRIACFVGSVNTDQIFNDTTGNRRFLMITCLELDYTHTVDMAAVYGQAYSMLLAGHKYWGDAEGNAEITANAQGYAVVDPVEEILMEFIEKPSSAHDFDCAWLSATAIVNEIALLHNKVRIPIEREGRRAGLVLTKLGLEKRITRGVACYFVKRKNRSSTSYFDNVPEVKAPF